MDVSGKVATSARLCDERAVLAAMVYVDLNPIRAGIAERLDASVHTSVVKRIEVARAAPTTLIRPLAPIMGHLRPKFDLSTAYYLQT
jgi:hypothetical protein